MVCVYMKYKCSLNGTVSSLTYPKLHQMQIYNFLQAWGEARYNSQTLLIMLVRLVAGEYVNGYTTAHAVSITVMYLKLSYAHSNVMN